MTYYLLSTQQTAGPPPPSVDLDRVADEVSAVEEDMKASGVWVFNGHLHGPSAATVVRSEDDRLLVTDGPYTETEEHVGGICIIRSPDLNAALAWAGRMARATTLPIEVRHFQGAVQD